jgi:hypothetical protein
MASLINKVDSEFTKDNNTISGLENEINNGKNIIANAIGTPLTSTDTFTEMGSDINGLLSTFKTNMMKNGVTVNSGDKFKALIDKIATLADNEGGLQYAEGTGTMTITASSGWTQFSFIDIDFDPTLVILRTYSTTFGLSSEYNIIDSSIHNSNSNYGILSSGYDWTPSCYISGKTVFASNSASYDCNYRVKWYAIGVGEEDTTLRDSLANILEDEGVEVLEEDTMADLIVKTDEEFDRKIDVKNGSYTYPITMTEDIRKITITHNLGKAPSFISIYIPYTSLYYLYGGYENYLQTTTTRAMNHIIDSRVYYDTDHRFIVLADSNRYVHAYITDITDTSFSFAMRCGMEGSGYEIHLDSFDWVVM